MEELQKLINKRFHSQSGIWINTAVFDDYNASGMGIGLVVQTLHEIM